MGPSLQMAVLLLLAGLLVLVLELFLPSAGTLFLVAMTCILASVVVAFLVSTLLGVVFLVVVCILAVVLPGLGLEIWKRSPIGRRMMLGVPGPAASAGVVTVGSDPPAGFDPQSLRGAVGKTLTPLRPSGMTEFGGRRVDTVAEGVMIGRGEYVRVIEVHGRRVVVRKINPAEERVWAFETEEPT